MVSSGLVGWPSLFTTIPALLTGFMEMMTEDRSRKREQRSFPMSEIRRDVLPSLIHSRSLMRGHDSGRSRSPLNLQHQEHSFIVEDRQNES